MKNLRILGGFVAVLAVAVFLAGCSKGGDSEAVQPQADAAAVADATDEKEEVVDWKAAAAGLNNATNDAPQITPSSKRPDTFDSVSPDTVLIRVGPGKLTKQDVLDDITIMSLLRRHLKGKGLSGKEISTIEKGVRRRAAQSFVSRELAYLTAKTNVNDEAMAKASRVVRDRYSSKFCREGETLDNVLSVLPKRERAHLEATMQRETVIEACIQKDYQSYIVVTDQELTNGIKRVARWNELVAATNAYAYATATNILKAVAKGADFAKLADELSDEDDKKPGGLVEGAVDADFCDGNFSYMPELNKLEVGEVSRILETNEGLQIVKCIKKDALTGESTFQRIILFIGVPYAPGYDSVENLTKIGIRQGYDAAMSELIQAAKPHYKVWYKDDMNFIAR